MRRVYSETVPIARLAESPVLGMLAERQIQLLAAVRPGQSSAAVRLTERARQLGLSIGLWPMLGDDAGRWLNPDSASAFQDWIDELLSAFDDRTFDDPPFDTLVLDLEPPIREVRALLDGRVGAARAWMRRCPSQDLHRRLVEQVADRGIESFAAVVPTVLFPGRAGRGWQRALGTPVDGIDYCRVSPMLYTSLFEGYGRGALRREDASELLRRWAALAVDRLGPRASVSLGAVGTGALGDEQVYRSPKELAEDVGVVRGVGCEDIVLFDLGGVLRRAPVAPWLDALAVPVPLSKPAAPTGRARALDSIARVTGVALDVADGLILSRQEC